VASISQSGITSFLNTALITQIGNSNHAAVRQAGVGFAATVSEIGSGNYASVYQH
jgi:hypothetical protein